MFCEKLYSNDPMAWLTIPLEQEPLLEALKRDLDAENSVRRLDAPPNPPPNSPQWQTSPNYQRRCRFKRLTNTPKKKPTALTQN
jgi:hypothetical protein